MASGWTTDNAVNEQIDATVEDGIRRAQARIAAAGPGATHCDECEVEIPAARRAAVPGARLCVRCQEEADLARKHMVVGIGLDGDALLVATDNRLPLTVALAYALTTDKISTELLDARKRELTDLVSEAAKTFGFQSKATLTNAFDVSVGLLSLALVNGTVGETLPDQWAESLVTKNWKSLAKDSIALVRTVTEPGSVI